MQWLKSEKIVNLTCLECRMQISLAWSQCVFFPTYIHPDADSASFFSCYTLYHSHIVVVHAYFLTTVCIEKYERNQQLETRSFRDVGALENIEFYFWLLTHKICQRWGSIFRKGALKGCSVSQPGTRADIIWSCSEKIGKRSLCWCNV